MAFQRGKRRTWKWRLAKWVLLPVLVLGALNGVFFYFMVSKFYPPAPEADFPEAQSLAQERAQDLEYFKRYLDLERAWPEGVRGEADHMLADLEIVAPGLSNASFDLEVGRIVAQADNGHSNVFASARSRRFGRVDIRTNWFEDGLYVLRATEEHEELLGLRLIAINGIQIEDYIEAFGAYYGGADNYKRDMSAFFIEAPELLAGAGFAVEGKSALYQFENSSGVFVEKELVAPDANPAGVRAFPHEWLYNGPKQNEPDGWISAYTAAEEEKPLYLRRDQRAFIKQNLPSLKAYYIGLRQNYNSETQKIGKFLKGALADIKAASPRYIILDVRHNGGGDYTTTSKHVKQLPGLVPADGHVFLISGSETFSAGMSTMGFVKQADPDKVTIVGEEPGDRMQFWSEGTTMTLPNSGAVMRFSTGYVDMVNPCDDYSKCYWLGALYPIEVESLSPDVRIGLSFADYISNIDPAMAWIEREIAR